MNAKRNAEWLKALDGLEKVANLVLLDEEYAGGMWVLEKVREMLRSPKERRTYVVIAGEPT